MASEKGFRAGESGEPALIETVLCLLGHLFSPLFWGRTCSTAARSGGQVLIETVLCLLGWHLSSTCPPRPTY
jgi:uncharacterized membrane protein YqaE (UPF0057 family)